MDSITDRLLSLRVDDVMTRQVVVMPGANTMAQAAELFRKHTISAAPVVDESGACIGILTASDFVRREQELAQHEGLPSPEMHRLSANPGNAIQMESVLQDAIGSFMSQSVHSVVTGASLISAARMMTSFHIHHLPVVDQQGCPLGMISTLDLAAALVNAVEEMKAKL